MHPTARNRRSGRRSTHGRDAGASRPQQSQRGPSGQPRHRLPAREDADSSGPVIGIWRMSEHALTAPTTPGGPVTSTASISATDTDQYNRSHVPAEQRLDQEHQQHQHNHHQMLQQQQHETHGTFVPVIRGTVGESAPVAPRSYHAWAPVEDIDLGLPVHHLEASVSEKLDDGASHLMGIGAWVAG